MSGERALVIQHPSAPVTFDQVRDDSGRVIAPAPQAVTPSEHPTDEQFQILAICDGLSELVRTYGAKRVMTWIRSLAAIHGQEI